MPFHQLSRLSARLLTRNLAATALFLGLGPTLAINLNYLVAAAGGFVPWCVPYWDSCTSISATGREGAAFYIFKLTMMPMALVYLVYWRSANRALRDWGYTGNTISGLGWCAAAALLCYTVALGAVGDSFQLVRRIGIVIFFGFTYLNQLLILDRLFRLDIPDPTRHGQLGLSLVTLLIGLLTVFLDAVLTNYDDYEDAFEWVLALLLHINFLAAYFGWRKTAGYVRDNAPGKSLVHQANRYYHGGAASGGVNP